MMEPVAPSALTIWTIGHSTRSIEDFLAVLHAHAIEVLVDVRLYPGSRRFPHFGRDALAASLAEAGIGYHHMAALGGRRKPRDDSRNTAWRKASFRGYADYMETAPFQAAIEELVALASTRRVAIMCAEVLWWQCHRGLISDRLKSLGHRVFHIHGATRLEEHHYTSAARIVDGRLSYAAGDDSGELFS